MRLSLCALLLLPFSIAAATIEPTDSALRAALLTESEITFNASGTIALTATLEINRDVRISGAGQTIIIDGQSARALIKVNQGTRLTLEQLTLANGVHRGANGTAFDGGAGGSANGGAIQNFAGDLVLDRCIVNNNSAAGGNAYVPFPGAILAPAGAAFGGAIFQSGGSLTVADSQFSGNSCAGGYGSGNGFARGGAIYSTGGAVTISDSTFNGNSTTGGPSQGRDVPGGDGSGGAVYVHSANLQVEDARFDANTAAAGANNAAYGGAIAVLNGATTIATTSFSRNQALGGPGIYWRGQFSRPGEPGRGGAIYVGANSTIAVQTSAFDSNTTRGGRNYVTGGFPNTGGASSHGGAVCFTETGSVVNSTFHANTAFNYEDTGPASGGAIESAGAVSLSFVTLANNSCAGPIIKSGGTATLRAVVFGSNNFAPNFEGTLADAGCNISIDGTPFFTNPTSANGTDPKLGPFGNYGGPTPTLPLLLGSPAIDRVADNDAPSSDQRLRPRPYGAHPDSGAFESSAPFHIFGQLHGVVPNVTTVNETIAPDASGRFLIANVASGGFPLNISAPNTVFRPNASNLDVHADMPFNARGFALRQFAWDPDYGVPLYTFAGAAGETWDFYSSYNLVDWFHLGPIAFEADGVHSIPLNQFPPTPVFLKTTRR